MRQGAAPTSLTHLSTSGHARVAAALHKMLDICGHTLQKGCNKVVLAVSLCACFICKVHCEVCGVIFVFFQL